VRAPDVQSSCAVIRYRAVASIAPLLLASACATLPSGAPRGEIVVVTDTGDAHIKAIELQHQDLTHAVSISGFEQGQSTVRKEVAAGHYCVESMTTFEIGAVSGGVAPQSLCFEVVAGEPTEIHVRVDASGRIGIAVQRAKPDPDPDLPIAGAG
jgi:hypothetical protein